MSSKSHHSYFRILTVLLRENTWCESVDLHHGHKPPSLCCDVNGTNSNLFTTMLAMSIMFLACIKLHISFTIDHDRYNGHHPLGSAIAPPENTFSRGSTVAMCQLCCDIAGTWQGPSSKPGYTDAATQTALHSGPPDKYQVLNQAPDLSKTNRKRQHRNKNRVDRKQEQRAGEDDLEETSGGQDEGDDET